MPDLRRRRSSAGRWKPHGAMLLAAFALVLPALRAQEATEPSRAETILAEEQRKAAHLAANAQPRSEQVFERFERGVVNPVFVPSGWSVKLGGLPTGGGFSLGPRYTRNDLFRDRLTSDTSVVGSTKLWWRGATSLELPYLLDNHMSIKLIGAYEDAASIAFYGEGPVSAKTGQSNFRREFTTGQFEAGLHTRDERVNAGYRIGGLLANAGKGRSNDSPSTSLLYTEANTPGVQRQSHYITGTSFVGVDLSSKGFNDPKGLIVDASNTQFWDQTWNAYSFDLFRTQALYRFTYANGMRTLAFRVKNQTAFTSANQTVPFYLQPTLGGPDDLRGYDRYRFYGNGASEISAEYHWAVAQTLELAFFADGGNVYQRPGLIGFRHNRGDGGFGVRLKNKDATFMRFDLGVSPEGVQAWFVFNPSFARLARPF